MNTPIESPSNSKTTLSLIKIQENHSLMLKIKLKGSSNGGFTSSREGGEEEEREEEEEEESEEDRESGRPLQGRWGPLTYLLVMIDFDQCDRFDIK